MRRIMQIFIISILSTAIFSCKKDSVSYQNLYQKSEKKYEEMRTLTQSISCENINDWYVDTLEKSLHVMHYLPVSNSIKLKYDQLKKEYEGLLKDAKELQKGPERQYQHIPIHFGVKCENGIAKVVTLDLLNEDQTRSALNQRFETLQNFYKDKPCTLPSDWKFISVIKDCSLIWIPILNEKNSSSDFDKILLEYNALYVHLAQFDKKLQNCVPKNTSAPKSMRCDNNKPVFVF